MLGQGSARSARSTKGWARAKPKTKAQRTALYARCGARAFLDPKRLKYPVVAAGGGCQPDCRGIRSAKSRAAAQHKPRIVKKADRIAASVACEWAP
jgi:hypothetical protein